MLPTILRNTLLKRKTSLYPRKVVCAANRKNGFIICGARHFDDCMRGQIKKAFPIRYLLWKVFKKFGPFGGWEQGFIDQKCEFITREEAYNIAMAASQISEAEKYWLKDKTVKTLISENIY